jgi:hypothetical protein
LTISTEARRINYNLALNNIMAIIGDGIYDSLIDPRLSNFEGIIRTTWEDLERDQLLVKDPGGIGFQNYHLTSTGWIAGLKLLGKLGEPNFQRDLKRLLAALKSFVEDRVPRPVLPDQIAARAGLSLEFVGNAIRANLLEQEFPNHLVDVEWRGWKRAVTIPGGF